MGLVEKWKVGCMRSPSIEQEERVGEGEEMKFLLFKFFFAHLSF